MPQIDTTPPRSRRSRPITLEKIQRHIANCPRCEGERWYASPDGIGVIRCDCTLGEAIWKAIDGDEHLLNLPPVEPDDRLSLDKSCVLYGDWDAHLGRQLFGQVGRAVWTRTLRHPLKVITDWDVRRASLAPPRKNSESEADLDRPDITELMSHPGLIVLRTPFAGSKNTEHGFYVYEAILERRRRPIWVTVEDDLPKVMADCKLLQQALARLPQIDFRRKAAA